jgi:predicted N-acetyltransferase YhbS
MEITLRLEEERDFRAVEDLTREAFWDIHVPGCVEHALIHNMRSAPEFLPALDFVAEADGKIVGNIVYARAKIICVDCGGSAHEHIVLTFGPVSVLPAHQNMGIGGKLINHTIPLAREMDYPAILIYGDPEYYKRFGFAVSKAFGITNKENKFPAALLVLELSPGALSGITGIFDEGEVYEITEEEAEEFDKGFPAKEKTVNKSQERFIELATKYL